MHGELPGSNSVGAAFVAGADGLPTVTFSEGELELATFLEIPEWLYQFSAVRSGDYLYVSEHSTGLTVFRFQRRCPDFLAIERAAGSAGARTPSPAALSVTQTRTRRGKNPRPCHLPEEIAPAQSVIVRPQQRLLRWKHRRHV